ncbi:MAG: hypothetical protein D8M52_04785 [Chlorobi bacterium]|nr:hypothetical protein [Chlorobiota bacterium]
MLVYLYRVAGSNATRNTYCHEYQFHNAFLKIFRILKTHKSSLSEYLQRISGPGIFILTCFACSSALHQFLPIAHQAPTYILRYA